MDKKMDYNALTGLVVTLFGAVYLLLSYMLPRAAIGNAMDPIYFPLGLGVLLVLVGLVLFIKSDKSMIKAAVASIFVHSEKEKEVSKMVFITCLSAVLYGLLFEHLGFVISTFGFMTSILFLTNGKKVVVNLLVASIFSVGIFALFNYALGIPLPGIPFI
ncbi:tripartite tricarboxylate transporter TctB family protein [Acidaminobacter sp. JC074]|uniref:tripartite tricarboxylate transporter TctB family protein n=1 Tax=Acidaminobacter sp. JC074 TaxID=2530199 RepID=UPI001F10A117|nr:tripartite tricarboxylate transporter TctB family protein [Acidaminobacter sp. JC074]MCH4890686.1 tripartite tricarboxylate transporter TctB family protein [Acidaminobacter sp. JC074]